MTNPLRRSAAPPVPTALATTRRRRHDDHREYLPLTTVGTFGTDAGTATTGQTQTFTSTTAPWASRPGTGDFPTGVLTIRGDRRNASAHRS
jgi:hypothetical protein